MIVRPGDALARIPAFRPAGHALAGFYVENAGADESYA